MMGIIFTSKWKQEIISGLSHISNFVRKIFLLLITHLCVWSRDVFGVLFSLSLSLSLSLSHTQLPFQTHCVFERENSQTNICFHTHWEQTLLLQTHKCIPASKLTSVCVGETKCVWETEKLFRSEKCVCVRDRKTLLLWKVCAFKKLPIMSRSSSILSSINVL